MSMAVWITLIVCSTILIVCALASGVYVRTRAPERVPLPPRSPEAVKPPGGPWELPPYFSSFSEALRSGEDRSEKPPVGLPVDPKNPPRPRTWNPKDPEAIPPSCICHNRPLVPGQTVVFWPYQGKDVVFCMEGDYS